MRVIKIKFDENEFWPLLSILNEVCCNLPIYNFEKIIGINRQIALQFFENIVEISKIQYEEKVEIELMVSDSELSFLRNCFDTVFKGIEEWEFQTLIGISIPEAKVLKEKFI